MLVKWISEDEPIPLHMGVAYKDAHTKKTKISIWFLHLVVRYLTLIGYWVKKPYIEAVKRAYEKGVEDGYEQGCRHTEYRLLRDARRANEVQGHSPEKSS